MHGRCIKSEEMKEKEAKAEEQGPGDGRPGSAGHA